MVENLNIEEKFLVKAWLNYWEIIQEVDLEASWVKILDTFSHWLLVNIIVLLM